MGTAAGVNEEDPYLQRDPQGRVIWLFYWWNCAPGVKMYVPEDIFSIFKYMAKHVPHVLQSIHR